MQKNDSVITLACMRLNMKISNAKQFPVVVWVLIIGAFFARGTFFMVWPFMAIILFQKFQLSPWEIGLFMSLAAVSAVVTGFFSGTLTDRYGRKNVIIAAGIISIFAFAGIAFANHIISYVFFMALCAISKEIWEPPVKALISDSLPNTDLRELAFQLRYFAINVGAAIGPLMGVWFGVTAQQETFLLTALSFVVLVLVLKYTFKHSTFIGQPTNLTKVTLKQTLHILRQDHVFLLLLIANMIVMFIYAHLDSSLVQYLTQSSTNNVIELVSFLIFTNACTIICLQFFSIKFLAHVSLIRRIYLGMFFLALSQLCFALNPIDFYAGWIIATFVMSVGETILFPNMNIQIDRIAPKHMKGVYFGAASFYSIGFASAPYIGGIILSAWSGSVLFCITFGLCFVVYAMYGLTQYAKRPNFEALIEKQIC